VDLGYADFTRLSSAIPGWESGNPDSRVRNLPESLGARSGKRGAVAPLVYQR
jgi:hypothetical protein